MEGKGKTLEGERTLFRRGFSLPPNLPHSPRTSPKSTRPYMAKSCFALHDAGALGGSFLSFWGGRDFLRGAAIAHGLRVGCGEERAGGALPADCAPAGCVTCQKCNVVGNDPCVVPVLGERYLLPTMESCTRVPRSRLPASLLGSTERRRRLL